VDEYVGLTINKTQAELARRRLLAEQGSVPSSTVQVFCADAAQPASWSAKVTKATSPSTSLISQPKTMATWLLGLDTLYHFRPSRAALFRHAHDDLHASIMAFDLLLSDSISFLDRVLLWAMCLLASTPFSNFVTRQAYIDQLRDAGYARDDIEMYDVSDHVFPGISAYLRRKGSEISPFGLGLGKYQGAGRVFDWWATSGVVRGFIVVARTGSHGVDMNSRR
jgi:hypothetical protein